MLLVCVCVCIYSRSLVFLSSYVHSFFFWICSYFCKPPSCPPCQLIALIRAKGTSWLCYRHSNAQIKLLRASLPVSEPLRESRAMCVCVYFVCASVLECWQWNAFLCWCLCTYIKYTCLYTCNEGLSIGDDPNCRDLCMAPLPLVFALKPQ